ncbi:MAG: hypothetical protein J0I70_01670 [Microbacterium sp.]|uniref:hypothetical protein n=1 Tax=Microbacterium sp. TaxID=51671 RepID=UPI001ACDD5E0|nr:hypothetical protein [Microbacterium sp.]MBN9172847.1 hypothetical protein [Microbacterium sp.]
MRRTWSELIRETRWLTSSRAALLLAVAAVAAAVWGAVSAATSVLSAVATFHGTLDRYRSHGEDIAGALSAPSVVTGDAAQQIISNPLRYDLDQAALAYTQVLPTGAASSTLSLCALLFFPLIGFAFGVFVSTHDMASGSIVFRWPRAGLIPFAASKPLLIVLVMCALAAVTGATAVPLSLLAQLSVDRAAADVTAFVGAAPSLQRTATIGALAVLTGSVSGALGLFVGSATRNRTFTIAAFGLAYFLVPLIGRIDPRNLVTSAGAKAFYFVGQFQPQGIGTTRPWVAVVVLIAGGVCFVGLSLIPWRVRARTARHS